MVSSEYQSNSGCLEAKYGLLYGICTDNLATNIVRGLHYTKKLIIFFLSFPNLEYTDRPMHWFFFLASLILDSTIFFGHENQIFW